MTTTPRAKRIPPRPSRFVAGPYDIAVAFYDAGGDETQDYGSFSPDRLEIRVRSDIAPQYQLNSLLHEAWHALHEAAYLNDGSTEEEFASRASVVYQAARYAPKNKPFWRYLDWLHKTAGQSCGTARAATASSATSSRS